MAEKILLTYSPRHNFPYNQLPTQKASMYGGSITPLSRQSYGLVLDCIYEMTDDVASANGWAFDKAMDQVLKDEGWRILPAHRKMIMERLVA